MATKNPLTTAEGLAGTAACYQKLLARAIRTAPPDDAVTLQRLGTGLLALTKALSAVEKLKKEGEEDEGRHPIEFTVLGEPVYRKR